MASLVSVRDLRAACGAERRQSMWAVRPLHAHALLAAAAGGVLLPPNGCSGCRVRWQPTRRRQIRQRSLLCAATALPSSSRSLGSRRYRTAFSSSRDALSQVSLSARVHAAGHLQMYTQMHACVMRRPTSESPLRLVESVGGTDCFICSPKDSPSIFARPGGCCC